MVASRRAGPHVVFVPHHPPLVAPTRNAQPGPISIDASRIEQKRASAIPSPLRPGSGATAVLPWVGAGIEVA